MSYPLPYQDWLDLADEFNDANAEAELDWFDADCVAAAQTQAATYDLPWPPSVGDYDRWYGNQFPRAQRDALTPVTRFDDDDPVATWLPVTYGP